MVAIRRRLQVEFRSAARRFNYADYNQTNSALVHPFVRSASYAVCKSYLRLNILPLLLAPAGTTKLFRSGDNQFLCALWTKAIQNFKSFSLRFIVGDEEPLNLMQQVAV